MPFTDINSEVKNRLSTSSHEVKEAVIVGLVQKELNRRAATITTLVERAEIAQKELFKLKPDIVSYNEDGTVKDASYSKPQLEAKKKATELLDKLNTAIDKALAGDFSKAYEIVNEKGGGLPRSNPCPVSPRSKLKSSVVRRKRTALCSSGFSNASKKPT